MLTGLFSIPSLIAIAFTVASFVNSTALLYFAYSTDLKNKELTDYIEKEQKRITDLYGESENLKVVPIDGKRMILSGNESIFWLDYIKIKFGGIQ